MRERERESRIERERESEIVYTVMRGEQRDRVGCVHKIYINR